MLAPYMEGTKPTLNYHLGTLNLASTCVTVIAKATSTNRPKLGLIGASGGCGRTMVGLDKAHFWWVNFYDLLDLAHGGVLRR